MPFMNPQRERFFEGPYGRKLAVPPEGPLFLYLREVEWVPTWINGGIAPFSLASSYLSDVREGTKTPDEVGQIRYDGASENQLSRLVQVAQGSVLIIDVNYNGRKLPPTKIDKFQEDAFILCFSTIFDDEIARRLGKKACVKIVDPKIMISCLIKQIGSGICYGPIRYTQTSERSHFMKHTDDGWMKEYRVSAPVHSSQLNFNVPAGLAELVCTY